MKRTSKIILFAAILLAGIGALAVYWSFYRPLPDYNANLTLPQLHQKVNIYWSPYGVPHIYARDKHDLYFALGYAHAQDRLWQMTLSQLAAQGRFAEFFGKDLLPLDEFQRTIGFWRIAKKMEAQLSDSTRQVLQAYADGVNQYVSLHPKELPVQFALTGVKPIKWTVAHSLALSRLMAWQLNIAWKTELTYNSLYQSLRPGQFKELFPSSWIPSSAPIAKDSTLSAVLQPLLNHYREYQQLMGIDGSHTGSNAWAVDGSHSSTGKPLLSGDPHLSLSMPGTWYEAHLNLHGHNLSGATLPGTPAVILGQNDVLSWSLTNVMLDDADFFEEKPDPQNPDRYMLDSLAGGPVYENFQVQHEVIKIKGENDTTFTRRLTKHGPVISDIYPEQQAVHGKTITLQWTGLQPSHELEALQGMGWARSIKQFKQAVKQFKVPAQNVIYADTSGNIALFTMGKVPIREGNPIVLRPGWKSNMDWEGYVPFKELPGIINPEKGWIANANNPVAPADYPYYLSVYWQPLSRYHRIEQFLKDNNRLSPQAFQVIQYDTYSAYAKTLTSHILPALEAAPDSAFAIPVNYLKNWDFKYDPSETAASILDVFLLRFSQNVFKDEMGDANYKNFIAYSAKPARILIDFLKNGSSFFDDVNTSKIEEEQDIIQKSMQQALTFLKDKFGSNPAEWRWENLHTLTLKPPLLGRAADDSSASHTLKLMVQNVLAKGPFPAPGNSMSINNGEYRWDNPYHMVLGPSIRRIIDLSNTRRSLSILPTGQSGNPFSDFYGDQTQNWLNGQYKFFYQDSSLFKNYRLMTLQPEK